MASKLKTLDIVHIAMFVVIMAVCSWISIPTVVPFTLQTLGLFLCIGMLGGKKGTITVAVYLLMGIIGIPVFASFTSGIGVILSLNGGYLIGFLLAAIVMWILEKPLCNSKNSLSIRMAIGLTVCYIAGTAWFTVVYANTSNTIGLWAALTMCVFPYIIPDILKILLALFLVKRVHIKER